MPKTRYEYHRPNIKGCKVTITVEETKINIKKRVQKIFDSLSFCYNHNGLVDTIKLASAFSFEVIEHEELQEQINGIITASNNGHQIVINSNLSKDNKRYIITYLLSTYLLYYQDDEFFIRKHLGSTEDFSAAYMARLLLIDEKILKEKIDNNSSKTLANIFQVPHYVMNDRINDFYNRNSGKIWCPELWKPIGVKQVDISNIPTSTKHMGFVEYQAPDDRYEVRGIMPSAKNRWEKSKENQAKKRILQCEEKQGKNKK